MANHAPAESASASVAWSGNRPCPSTGHACISPQATVWQMRKLLNLAVVHRVYTAIPTTISREARLGKSCACRISKCPLAEHACISPQATVWQMRKLLTHHLAVVHRVYTAIPTTISREARLGKSCACRISNCKCGLEWKQTMSVGGTCLYKSPGNRLADEEIAHTPSSGGAQSVHCHPNNYFQRG